MTEVAVADAGGATSISNIRTPDERTKSRWAEFRGWDWEGWREMKGEKEGEGERKEKG